MHLLQVCYWFMGLDIKCEFFSLFLSIREIGSWWSEPPFLSVRQTWDEIKNRVSFFSLSVPPTFRN